MGGLCLIIMNYSTQKYLKIQKSEMNDLNFLDPTTLHCNLMVLSLDIFKLFDVTEFIV